MKHRLVHDLDAELAKRAADKAAEAYRARYAKYDPQLIWIDATHARVSFSVKGIKLEGRIALVPRALELELDVPFVFRVFKGKALAILQRELDVWTAKAKAGEL